MKKLLILMLAAASVCCKPKEIDLTGTWTQPVPGQAGGWSQGMQLNADGTASSVNMYTLVLESWKREGDKLILTGKSVGNGINIARTTRFSSDRERMSRLSADCADKSADRHGRT